jgi:hypothetical protein
MSFGDVAVTEGKAQLRWIYSSFRCSFAQKSDLPLDTNAAMRRRLAESCARLVKGRATALHSPRKAGEATLGLNFKQRHDAVGAQRN